MINTETHQTPFLMTDFIELSYCFVNHSTQEITWKPMGWTPKRTNAVHRELEIFSNSGIFNVTFLNQVS